MPIYSGLAALLDDVAGRVDRWTRQEAWEPEPGSPGAAELANTEVRADGSPWGERPTRTVFQLGQMQMKMVVEYAGPPRCWWPLSARRQVSRWRRAPRWKRRR